MGLELGRAWVRVRGDCTGLRNDLNIGKRETEQVVNDMSHTISSLIAPFTAAAASLITLRKALMASGQFEQTTIAFDTMLGSAKATKDTLQSLTEFAAKTPFEMPEILQAARGLIQFGERGEELMDTLNLLGNAASGTSTPFGFLALVFNQVRGVGKLLTQDFRQLSTRGVISLMDIAKYYGVTTQAAQEMLSKGKISFEDLKNILRMLSEEGGRFANLMEKQSQSLLGLWSTWKDDLGIIVRYMGETVTPTAKQVLVILIQGAEYVRSFIENHNELVGSLFKAITVVTALGVAWKGVAIAARGAAIAEAVAAAVSARVALAAGTGIAAGGAATTGAAVGGGVAVGVGLKALFVAGAVAAAKFVAIALLVAGVIWAIGKAWDWVAGKINKANDSAEEYEKIINGVSESIEEAEKKKEKQKTWQLPKEEDIGRTPIIPLPGAGTPVKNRDNSISTERTITVNINGMERVIPTLLGGKQFSEEQAINAAIRRGIENFPSFKSPDKAEEYAKERSRLLGLQEIFREEQRIKNMQLAYHQKYAKELEWIHRGQWEESTQFFRMQKLTPFFGQEDPLGEARKFIYDITDSPLRQFNELVAKIQACTRAGLGFADASRIIKEEWQKSPMYAPTKQLEEMRQTLLDLQNGTKDWEKQVREFSKQPFVTQADIEEFASLSKQIADFKENAKAKKPESLISAGRYGFSDFFGQIQDALLKKDDPQKKLVEQSKATNNLLTSIEKNTRMQIGALK